MSFIEECLNNELAYHPNILSMSDPEYDKVSSKGFKNCCIMWIEKIQNPQLKNMYETYKSSVHPATEKRLFHGTSESVARIIAKEGFNPSLNKASMYGLGVYFATNASHSKPYASSRRTKGQELAYMLVCDVVVGNSCIGKPNQPIPEPFHSATDKGHTIYVVNKKEAALPLYIVCFYPDAK